jgi:hypothetical protein
MNISAARSFNMSVDQGGKSGQATERVVLNTVQKDAPTDAYELTVIRRH